MVKKLFVHIGTGKTGSTALQYFLNQYSDSLRDDYSLSYVRSGRGKNRRERGHQHAKFSQSVGLETTELSLDIAYEIGNSDTTTHVISSEQFSTPRPGVCPRVYLYPLMQVAEVHVVLYVRPQDQYIDSLYAQWLKKVERLPPVGGIREFYQQRQKRGWPDYYRLARRWEDVVGLERVHVRPYDRKQLLGGDIVRDFLSLLGIPDACALAESETSPANPSLTVEQIRVIEALYECGLEHLDSKELRRPRGGGGTPRVMNEALRRQVLDDYAESNSKLVERYLDSSWERLFSSSLDRKNDNISSWFELSREYRGWLEDYFARLGSPGVVEDLERLF